jgi:hypothetical protein
MYVFICWFLFTNLFNLAKPARSALKQSGGKWNNCQHFTFLKGQLSADIFLQINTHIANQHGSTRE